MKTFQEACHAVLVRPVKSDEVVEGEDCPPDMMDASHRYDGVRIEIENSLECQAFVNTLLKLSVRDDVHPAMIIAVAFSHGVMVGMEMEKQ